MNTVKINLEETNALLDFHNLSDIQYNLKNVFNAIERFGRTQGKFALILDSLSNARFLIDELKENEQVVNNPHQYLTNADVEEFLFDKVDDYELNLSDLEDQFSEVYQKSFKY